MSQTKDKLSLCADLQNQDHQKNKKELVLFFRSCVFYTRGIDNETLTHSYVLSLFLHFKCVHTYTPFTHPSPIWQRFSHFPTEDHYCWFNLLLFSISLYPRNSYHLARMLRLAWQKTSTPRLSSTEKKCLRQLYNHNIHALQLSQIP